jgi:hypothetical protein
MKDKHFIFALALLVLPLSFGGDSTAGTKAAAEMDASHRVSLKRRGYVVHGFTVAQMAELLAGIPIGSPAMGKTKELFVSSLDASKDAHCGNAANVTSDPNPEKLNGDCFALNGGDASAKNSASGFPMYDSFRGSDTAQYSHSGGNNGPIGVGSGAGGGAGGGASMGPIVNDPVNPTAPISAPEPGTLMMLATGLVMLGAFARRKMRGETVSAN